MRNFDFIAASPENLGKFLASIPVANSPWDAEFQKTFCASCGRKDCDAEPCPHQDARNNPTWWLYQVPEGETEMDEQQKQNQAVPDGT